MPRFLIGSSYFDGGKPFRKEFARIWHWNTLAANPFPSRVVIVAEGGGQIPLISPATDVIHLTGDLGHIGQHMSGEKKHEFTGWSSSMLAGAMLAYSDCADFIYKEDDCLAFGPWVEQMYADAGDRQFVFGRRMTSPPRQLCSQSLFMVRHSWIPTFVREYLALGNDGQSDNMGEHKFWKIEQKYGSSVVARLSFGVDRERPIPWDDRVWFAQQWTSEELDEARRRKLI